MQMLNLLRVPLEISGLRLKNEPAVSTLTSVLDVDFVLKTVRLQINQFL